MPIVCQAIISWPSYSQTRPVMWVVNLAYLLATSLVALAAPPTTTELTRKFHKSNNLLTCYQSDNHTTSVYNFTLKDVHGEKTIPLSTYKGKVLVIVNVASFWGATPQYLGLNALQEEFKEFQVLGFPCNQFWLQEPGANGTEIMNCLKYVRPGNNFQPMFPLFEKLEVNGKNEHPLYTYLKLYCPSPKHEFSPRERLMYKPMSSHDIRWNFEKFLINRHGKPVMRFTTSTLPSEMREYITNLLEESH